MTEPTIDEFLRLEDASTKLLVELEALRDETTTFKDANTTLTATGERLNAFLAKASEATQQIGESARVLREIGTPQIMTALAAQGSRQAALHDVATRHYKDAAARAADAERQMSSLSAQVNDASEKSATSLSQHSQLAAERALDTEKRLKTLSAHVASMSEQAAASLVKSTGLLRLLVGSTVISIALEVWLLIARN